MTIYDHIPEMYSSAWAKETLVGRAWGCPSQTASYLSIFSFLSCGHEAFQANTTGCRSWQRWLCIKPYLRARCHGLNGAQGTKLSQSVSSVVSRLSWAPTDKVSHVPRPFGHFALNRPCWRSHGYCPHRSRWEQWNIPCWGRYFSEQTGRATLSLCLGIMTNFRTHMLTYVHAIYKLI